MLSLGSNSMFLILSLLLTLTACGQPKPAEQIIYDILQDDHATFYFKDDFGDRKGEAFTLAQIYNVKSPKTEKLNQDTEFNQSSLSIEDDNNFDAPLVAEMDNVIRQKAISPLYQSNSGLAILKMNDGKGYYFRVGMNYETNLPMAISFQTSIGSHEIQIHYYYNEVGELSEYSYQELEPNQNWETVSYKFIDEKQYIYKNSSMKVEKNLDVEDKKRVLEKSILLNTLVSNLWQLYAECTPIPFDLIVDANALTTEIDSVINLFQVQKTLDKNNKGIWELFKGNKIQIIYSVKKEGINVNRGFEMFALIINNGKVYDKKITMGIEEILKKHINCKDSQYRCLSRNGSGQVSIIIENGKVVQIEY